ncbi:hypothetical protein GCM10020255_016960 [Rhodococcus baikonurensis]
MTGTSWDAVKLHDFGDFISALRYGELDSPIRELRPRPTLSDSTVNLRMRAVMSFYRYQADSGTDAAPFLWKQAHVRSGRYLSFLEHGQASAAEARRHPNPRRPQGHPGSDADHDRRPPRCRGHLRPNTRGMAR